jgi:nucleotide-binding universal stress UspA family protein
MRSRQFPHLSILDIPIDPAVARQLPRGLAEYYVALPVGRDQERLTVAMARPCDRKPIALLESLLGTAIVPVQAAAPEVRAAIKQVWQEEEATPAQILCCDGIPALAERFAASLHAELVTMHDGDALAAAQHGNFLLTVTPPGSPDNMARWVRTVPGALLFTDNGERPVRQVLVVLRGHSPDEQALRFVLPLAQEQRAAITLLGIGDNANSRLTRWLLPGEQIREQVYACATLLRQAGLNGSLKLREGEPASRIALELADTAYDLLVMAAEAHGDAVSVLLSALQAAPPPILILKPELNERKV